YSPGGEFYPPQTDVPVYGNSLSSYAASQDQAERERILYHLELSGGNVKLAAETLGISRRTLYRKFEKYHINYR
ncbi:MAG: hypothetical protein LUE86_01765, partial [Clostridiales bacterium]|nr:hypothetical protein [Clostridiales bacterium]